MSTHASSPRPALDDLELIDPGHYAEFGYPHDAWAQLRREAPLYWFTRTDPDTPPFWAVTRHADIVRVSKQPKLFLNAPRLAVLPEFPAQEGERLLHHLLNMDPPQHGAFRALASRRFTPRALRSMAPDIEALAESLVDDLAARGPGGTCDFVESVAAVLPLAVIADILGAPREDWRQLFDWTNAAIGSTDPEYQAEGERAADTANRSRLALFEYFTALAETRRKDPRDDLVSVLSRASIEGGPLPPRELLSYFFLIVIAGNETTRNATSGGLLALIEHPEQLARLRAEPELLDSAVEEILRWTSPVIQFTRTAAQDTELAGQPIRAGESLCLFYPSANRDEAVFDAPNEFRIDRKRNPHLAFGIGEHFCLGANVARLELRLLFRHLLARLTDVELAGPVERLRSSFVGGIKHMPIRYSVRESQRGGGPRPV